MITRFLVVLLCVGAASALAEDPKAKAAREELERQLSQMVGKQPTKVRVDFIGLDDPNYKLEEATFELDNRLLGSPSLAELSDDGTHLVWNGDVTPGKHVLKVRLVFSNGASVVLSDEGGYKWKIGGDVGFDVNSGIEVRVQVTPKRDGKQTDVAKRFKLALPAQPVMIAQLDDGKMPDAMPKPVIATPDAGLSADAIAADEKKKAADEAKLDAATEAKKLAAEEKKQKAAEALEAKKQAAAAALEAKNRAAEEKKLAAEEKKQKAAAALEAKKLAAEEKKQAAVAALEAKARAAEEKRLEAEAKKQAALDAAAGKQPVTPENNTGGVVDAGAPAVVAEVVDAGVPDAGQIAVAVVAVVDAGVPAPVAVAPPPAEGPPWVLIGAAGGLAAAIFLILVARRRSRPPTLDD